MSSWPWMKGTDVESWVETPIPLVTPHDDRPALQDLLQEHNTKITKLRTALEEDPLFEPTKHDNLWILRFWLSHKNSKQALQAAKHTLQFRRQHGLDEKDIRRVNPNQVPDGKIREFRDCWDADAVLYAHPDPQRGILTFLKIAGMDQHRVVQELTPQHWEPLYVYTAEWTFQWLDYLTRTTGRLTRNVRLIDMTGFTMSGYNRECTKRDSAAMAAME